MRSLKDLTKHFTTRADDSHATPVLKIYLKSIFKITRKSTRSFRIQKLVRDNLQEVGNILISGGVDNMEKYQYMLGQARTYQLILQEISNLLDNKEQKDEKGTVIDLNSRGPKT